jgi:hypothetical protein
VRIFSELADLFGLGLRPRERCIVRLKVVLDQTPDDHYLDPIHVALLIVLRIKQQTLFAALANGSASSDDGMDCLIILPGGEDFVFDRNGIVLVSYLIESGPNLERRSAAIARISAQMNSEDLTEKQRSRYIDLHRTTSNERYGMRVSSPSIANVAAKIDIAAYIRG